jgi:glycosyltransferase involved in cell wall biosynthesis
MTIQTSLIIPALNEAECIPAILGELPSGIADEVIVVDNGSTDGTGDAARNGGARVILEPRRGYGYACAAGASAARGTWIAFMDGDGSFVSGELIHLLQPLQQGAADLVLGSRLVNEISNGSMPAHQLFGNRLVATLVNKLYHTQLTDLGPFRALSRSLLDSLDMRELTYGWSMEMIVKTARRRNRIMEIPVTFRPRLAGKSKIGGNLRGTILATYRIFRVLFRYAL